MVFEPWGETRQAPLPCDEGALRLSIGRGRYLTRKFASAMAVCAATSSVTVMTRV